MSTTLSPTDPRTHLAEAVATARATIAAVRPDQLELPTPCAAFEVRSLIGHLLIALRRVAALGNGSDPMALPETITGVADDRWAEAFLADAHEVQLAWTDDAKLEQTMILPWATAPGSTMLAMYTAEVLVHTWDLAEATGQRVQWPEPAVRAAMAWAEHGLPPGDREALFAAMAVDLPHLIDRPPFRNPRPVAADAPLIDRLVAWSGRQPASAV